MRACFCILLNAGLSQAHMCRSEPLSSPRWVSRSLCSPPQESGGGRHERERAIKGKRETWRLEGQSGNTVPSACSLRSKPLFFTVFSLKN